MQKAGKKPFSGDSGFPCARDKLELFRGPNECCRQYAGVLLVLLHPAYSSAADPEIWYPVRTTFYALPIQIQNLDDVILVPLQSYLNCTRSRLTCLAAVLRVVSPI